MHATAAAHNTAQATEEDAAKGGGSFPDVETLPKSSDSAEAGMMCQTCAQGVELIRPQAMSRTRVCISHRCSPQCHSCGEDLNLPALRVRGELQSKTWGVFSFRAV